MEIWPLHGDRISMIINAPGVATVIVIMSLGAASATNVMITRRKAGKREEGRQSRMDRGPDAVGDSGAEG